MTIPIDIRKRIRFTYDCATLNIEEFVFMNNNIIFCGLDCTLDLVFTSYHIDNYQWRARRNSPFIDYSDGDILETPDGYIYDKRMFFDKAGRLLSTKDYELNYFDNTFLIRSVKSKYKIVNIELADDGSILHYSFDDYEHIYCHYNLINGKKRLILCAGLFDNQFESFMYNDDGSLIASIVKSGTNKITLNEVIYEVVD